MLRTIGSLVLVLGLVACGSAVAGPVRERRPAPTAPVTMPTSAPGTLPVTTSTVGPASKAMPPHLVLFGDSLSWEAEQYFAPLIRATGQTFLTFNSYGGTATCDWLDRMQRAADSQHLEAAVIQFSGNALTPCMTDTPPGTPAYVQKYYDDTMAAVRIFAAVGAHVFLIGAPISFGQFQTGDADVQPVNELYAYIARDDPAGVTYVDAGAAVEGLAGAWVKTLPCLVIEPCIGPVVGGVANNVVRAPDGAHFCPVAIPVGAGVIDRCPVYSSGAFRFANAIASALGVA